MEWVYVWLAGAQRRINHSHLLQHHWQKCSKHQHKFLLFRKVWQELVSIPFLTTSYRILFVMHIYNQDPFPFFSSYLFGRVIKMATLYSSLALLITYIFVFLISPSTSSPHTHVHISTSDFHDVKRERVKKKQSTWLLFNVVSQAFSGLWWFNSCCYKHLLPALSRSQLRLIQPCMPYLIYA